MPRTASEKGSHRVSRGSAYDQRPANVERYFERELSWLRASARLLEEAEDRSTPLLERVRFLAFFSTKLDGFFRNRRPRPAADTAEVHSARRPRGDAAKVRRCIQELVVRQHRCFSDQLRPALERAGVYLCDESQLDDAGRSAAENYYQHVVYPLLTPQAIDSSHPKPVFRCQAVYLAVLLRGRGVLGPRRLFAVLELPSSLPRFLPLKLNDRQAFVSLDEMLTTRLARLFGGYRVVAATSFRWTRGKLPHDQQAPDDGDLIEKERQLRSLLRAPATRLELAAGADRRLVERLCRMEELPAAEADGTQSADVYEVGELVDLSALLEWTALPGRDDLRYGRIATAPLANDRQSPTADILAAVARRDILFHHPYDSVAPVAEFLQRAAHDEHVERISQTLYRTGAANPLVEPLIVAARRGKRVTALVELNARFDETDNILWARRLREAGARVAFGIPGLKTHAKLLLVERREHGRLRPYVHIATGNYQETIFPYTDLSLLTADEDIGRDAAGLFDLLSGDVQRADWRKLIVAPYDLLRRTTELIDEQTARARRGEPSRIIAKLNSIGDHCVIEALYEASTAGVPIDLIVRGVCLLRPALTGMSENIRVRSVVDRFHEHSRFLVFGPDEDAAVFLSTADWMPRNFQRRIELMCPVDDEPAKQSILTEIVPAYLSDTVKVRILRADGTFTLPRLSPGGRPLRCQERLLQIHRHPAAGDRPDRYLTRRLRRKHG